MRKLIEIADLYAGYNNQIVLSNISITVFENDFIGIIGPNGGGKTTLLKAITGLIKPFSGSITYYNEGSVSKGFIGYLPQINQFDKKFPINVTEVVLSGLLSRKKLISGYSRIEKESAIALLDQMHISHLARKPVGELSGGQMQRVFLCRALIAEPSVLILDEPDTYVDNRFESELYDILAKLNQKLAIMVVSHDIGIISSYVKTIACINRELHYHQGREITPEILQVYNCPIDLIAHGPVPHRVLQDHEQNDHDHEHH
jgi:zinc transport system ATP-binding protein